MGNFKHKTVVVVLVLMASLVMGAAVLWKKRSAISNESTMKTSPVELTMTADPSIQNRRVKNRRSRKKAPPAAVAALTETPSSPEKTPVETSTEIFARLPSAQEEVGNDPTVLRSRVETGYEYLNIPGGSDRSIVTLRLDGAPSPKLAFRLDLPYVSLPSPESPSLDRGWAEITVRGSAVIKKTPRAGFTGFCDFWFDTAESKDFGAGKYSAGPGIVAALMNSYKDMLLSAALQHKFSYAGDSSRTDINRTKLDITINKSLWERTWVVVNPMVYLDWVSQKSAGNIEFEAGARMGENWNAWVRPGVGLWGQAVSGGYNSYCQAGVRYIFGAPIREKILKELREIR